LLVAQLKAGQGQQQAKEAKLQKKLEHKV